MSTPADADRQKLVTLLVSVGLEKAVVQSILYIMDEDGLVRFDDLVITLRFLKAFPAYMLDVLAVSVSIGELDALSAFQSAAAAAAAPSASRPVPLPPSPTLAPGTVLAPPASKSPNPSTPLKQVVPGMYLDSLIDAEMKQLVSWRPLGKAGPVIRVGFGNIVDQDTRALVSSASETLEARSAVAKAILAAAGPSYARDMQALSAKGLTPGSLIVTNNGGAGTRLRAYWIIHVVPPRVKNSRPTVDDVEAMTTCIYNAAGYSAEQKYGSLSLPALGVGPTAFPADEAARITIHSLLDVWKNYPDGLQEVRLVCGTDVIGLAYARVLMALASKSATPYNKYKALAHLEGGVLPPLWPAPVLSAASAAAVPSRPVVSAAAPSRTGKPTEDFKGAPNQPVKSGGVVPVRKSRSGEIELLLPVERRDERTYHGGTTSTTRFHVLGGKIDAGEDAPTCAAREFSEETAQVVTVADARSFVRGATGIYVRSGKYVIYVGPVTSSAMLTADTTYVPAKMALRRRGSSAAHEADPDLLVWVPLTDVIADTAKTSRGHLALSSFAKQLLLAEPVLAAIRAVV